MSDAGVNLITLENVIKSINELHSTKDEITIRKASYFLTRARSSVEIWSICDQLLYRKTDVQTTFFAAQTLRNKIEKSSNEIPRDKQMSFKDSLMNHVKNLGYRSNREIYKQLCLTVADLYIQMSLWTNSLSEIYNQLATSDNGTGVFLTILKYIAEEMDNDSILVGLNRKKVLEQDLMTNVVSILNILNKFSEKSDERQLKLIFDCLSSWISHLNVITDENLFHSVLMERLFLSLQHPSEIGDSLYSACCELVATILDTGRIDDLLQTQLETFKGCFYLFNVMMVCIERDYYEKSIALANTLKSMGSFLFEMLFKAPGIFKRDNIDIYMALDNLISVAGIDYEYGIIIFNSLDIISDLTGESNFTETLLPVKRYLTDLVLKLSDYFPSSDDGIKDEATTELKKNVSDLIDDVPLILDCEKIFHTSITKLADIIINKPNEVMQSEAAIFTMSLVVSYIDYSNPTVSRYLLDLIGNVLLPNLPGSNMKIKIAAITLFAKLLTWFDDHNDIRDRIMGILAAIIIENVSLKKNSKLFAISVKALTNISDSDPSSIQTDHYMLLYKTATVLIPMNDPPNYVIAFYRILATLISQGSIYHEPEMIGEFFRSIFLLFKTNVTERLDEGIEQSIEEAFNGLKEFFEEMAVNASELPLLFDSDSFSHLALVFTNEIWDFLKFQLQNSQIRNFMEYLVDIIKNIFHLFGRFARSDVPSLCLMITQIYNSSFEPSFLSLAEIIVNTFLQDDDQRNLTGGITNMIKEIASSTMNILDEQLIHENEQLVLQFFQLMNNLVEEVIEFMNEDHQILNQVLNLSMAVVNIGSYKTKSKAIHFLNTFLQIVIDKYEDENNQILYVTLWLEGLTDETFLFTFLKLVASDKDFHNDSETYGKIGGIILNIRDIMGEAQFKSALKATIKRFPTRRNDGSEFVTNSQLKELIHDITTLDDLKDVITYFGKLYR